MQSRIIKKYFILFLTVFSLQACAINDKHELNNFIESSKSAIKNLTSKPLTQQDIAAGLKEALKVGSERVVTQVGKENGYLNDKLIHIALPAKLQKVHNRLDKIGLGKYTNELEVKMNRAAEIAAPKAKQLFWSAIKEMSWQDVHGIYKGPEDAATQYFKEKMSPALRKMMRPLIRQVLADAGVVKAYNKVVNKYNAIPFVTKVHYDLEGYVMDKGINGMFFYLAREEAAIRKDPVKRTTALLRRVFG